MAIREITTQVYRLGDFGKAHWDDWLGGLTARLVFAAVLWPYYLNSAMTKPGMGPLGIFMPGPGAFAQIIPTIAEAHSYDPGAIAFFPWHIIVIAGTLAEFVLPILIVLGGATRLAALGMVGFIIVQSLVDIFAHGAMPGALFDGDPASVLDQRVLWVFPLIVLAAIGGGRFAIDRLLWPRLRNN
ncbi:DoxX family membrane protein [Thalassospira sp. NFXS8]|uniref:DoxX family protein n=1 Tax=Thalassospira sp. NFXS8 TaxID=2819093 RepID=UPI0032DF7AAA